MTKKDKDKLITTGTATAITGGVGLAGASLLDTQKAKVVYRRGPHPAEELESVARKFKSNLSSGSAREGDIIISNNAEAFNKKRRNQLFFSADQGNAAKDIRDASVGHNMHLGWGTEHPSNADWIFGTKGIKGEHHQNVVELDGIAHDNIHVPGKMEHVKKNKQIALTYGNASQSGTLFGVNEPFYSAYRRTKDGNVLQPTSKLDTGVFDNILSTLDKKYGKNAYDLEVFTGTDSAVHNLLSDKYKNSTNIKLTQKVPKDKFVKSIFSKDLVFTNPGLNLASMARSERKIPTILMDTHERAPHNANYTENIKWFKSQQHNAQDILTKDIRESPDKLLDAINRVESSRDTGKAMVFNEDRVTSVVGKLLNDENSLRNSTLKNKFKYRNKGMFYGGLALGALGLGAGAYSVGKKK